MKPMRALGISVSALVICIRNTDPAANQAGLAFKQESFSGKQVWCLGPILGDEASFGHGLALREDLLHTLDDKALVRFLEEIEN
jgi:hypothetical protein